MAELPRGITLETRRGGPDVLRTLVEDFFTESQDGYIRIERTPKEQLPRIGQVVISNGNPIGAIHEQNAIHFSIDALIEIEEDAMRVDSLITVISEVDVAHIDSLFPEARLHVDTAWSDKLPQNVGERWWLQREVREATWSKASENFLPEYESVVEAPEFIQRAAAIRRARMDGELCGELTPGQVLLLDATDNQNSFRLASELSRLGRPVLVLSRLPKERLVEDYQLPSESCWWLTERPGGVEQACGARLEDITRTISDFLSGNPRAIVVLDGLEFLSSVHGTERTFGFLRRLVDNFHNSDDALMVPVDLFAWEEKEQRLLLREAEKVGSSQVLQWLDDIDALATHPLCAPPTEEEKEWIESALKAADEKRKSAQSLTQTEAKIGTANRFSAGDFAQEWLNDTDENKEISSADEPDDNWVPTFHSAKSGEVVEIEHIEEENPELEIVEIEEEIEIVSKPRPPHRLGRRREVRSSTQVDSSEHKLRREGLIAAVESASDLDDSILERKSSSLDNRLAKARSTLEAVGVASTTVSERISHSSLPISELDADRERRLGEWKQAVVAGKGKVASILDDSEEYKPWDAAVAHARNPLHLDPEVESIALSPLMTRPGVEIDLKKKGRESAHREQKDMSVSSVSRRIAEQDHKRNKEGRIVTTAEDLGV